MKKVLVLLALVAALVLCLVSCSHIHNFGEWSVTKNATCAEEGVKTRYCDCGEKQSDVIPSAGHNYVDGECTNCGDVKETPECKHNNYNVLAAVDSTCTETGLTEGKQCSDCGEILVAQEETPLKDHTEEIIPAEESTCTEKGLTEGKKCSICGDIIVAQQEAPLKEHTEEIIPAVESTCTEKGLTEGKKCSVCGETLVAQEESSLKTHTEVVDSALNATCTSTGLTEGKHCSACGTVLLAQQEIPVADHEKEIIKGYAATCTSNGLTDGEKCNKCGEILTEQTVIEAAHTEVIDNAVAATCSRTGLTEGKHCSVCGTVLVAQTVVPKTDHDYNWKVVVKAPTCTSKGYSSYYCRCGNMNTGDYVDKLPHTFGDWVTVKEATSTEGGLNERSCKCGSKETVPVPVKVSETPAYVRDGDYIYFGEYPQTIKADDVTISSITDNRGYYLGFDGFYYAKVTTRNYNSGYKFSNGTYVKKETTYYFKVEPIRWRIICEENGEAFLLCDSIIEKHRFDDDDNNYAESEIRSWLNSTFYETVFSEFARSLILTTEVDNSASSTTNNPNTSNPNACENTYDKVFLLSFAEATNSAYGFSSDNKKADSAKSILTSDYFRASGEMSTLADCYGNGDWYLRSPSGSVDFNYGYCVSADGSANCVCGIPNNLGVVPALRITLEP